ncbi:MAG TPA: DUF72 domain-containing protein [Frankiaceae bacterium]|nr:DUF72 domain-containing protein [Frankiaceae bacterium]
MARWAVGTSGWQYAHWRGHLYPPGLPQRRWLERHAEVFASVELNAPFYRLPERDTFTGWADRTPPDYEFAVKASRYLTHVRRLRDPAEPVARLMDRAAGLGTKLGPVLVQLPPTLQADPTALADTLACFPAVVRVAVELRHPSWESDEVRGVLQDAGAALVWADRDSRPRSPLWRTADWGYLRLHAGRAEPWPRYGRRALATWVRRLEDAFGPDHDVYVYTNNDPGGAALVDAAVLARIAAVRGMPVTRAPSAAAVR